MIVLLDFRINNIKWTVRSANHKGIFCLATCKIRITTLRVVDATTTYEPCAVKDWKTKKSIVKIQIKLVTKLMQC